ncbi:GNAT family N-acetyltransferase [bacterium]|nr:GNAT family N-acetyltransferase [bacterium]
MIEGYRLTDNKNEMDVNVIHSYISKSYWANGIPIDVLEKAIENSLCFAVVTAEGELVGFSRVITDYATYAYLSDVFVNEAHQGKGLSKELLTAIARHPMLQGLRRVMLATKDAHGLYKQFGFSELASPERFMERWEPNIYS